LSNNPTVNVWIPFTVFEREEQVRVTFPSHPQVIEENDRETPKLLARHPFGGKISTFVFGDGVF
jgi:hypothetical protein